MASQLLNLIESHGITYKELAQEIGISASSVGPSNAFTRAIFHSMVAGSKWRSSENVCQPQPRISSSQRMRVQQRVALRGCPALFLGNRVKYFTLLL
jgi:transcriptional regulator with XRE-family HTH domain